MAEAARIAQEHADLAVLDPPGRAGILPRDTDRVRALLQEAGFIDNQHAIGITKRFDGVRPNQISQTVRLPLAPPEQRLHPVRPRRPCLLSQQPARLAHHPDSNPSRKAPPVSRNSRRPNIGPSRPFRAESSASQANNEPVHDATDIDPSRMPLRQRIRNQLKPQL